MNTQNTELKYSFCEDCVEVYEHVVKANNPDFIFNTYISISNKRCVISGCDNVITYNCIGVRIPDSAGALEVSKKQRPIKEIFSNAKEYLEPGEALDRLVVFLKSKIIPQNPGFTTDLLLRQYAMLVLDKLKISYTEKLSDSQISAILKIMRLYPEDWR